MTAPSRNFKGIWIPANIWLDKRLTYFERCLFAEINSLDGDKGCYASNDYFCTFFGERERKIQEGISKLKQLGYIEQESFDGRTRVLRIKDQDVKTLFSTSEVRNSAPLPCPNPHLSSNIENKEENKEQQQQEAAPAAAAFLETKEHKHKLVYACLADVQVSQALKRELTKTYSEQVVSDAKEWALNQPGYKKSLGATLRYACANEIKEEALKCEIKPYDKIAKTLQNGMTYNGTQCYLDEDRVIFVKGTERKYVKFEDFSWKIFRQLCDDFGITKYLKLPEDWFA